MVHAAFDPKEVTGEVLTRDRQIMELWKWAANEGQIQAVTIAGRNYAVVKDEDLVRRIAAAAPQVQRFAYDDAAGRLV